MKRTVLAALAALGGVSAAAASNERTLVSKVTEVTLYADRAQVTRTASVDVPRDGERYVFANLPGWIDEESVRVAVVPPEAGRILDVQVVRSFLARSPEAEVAKAEAAVREVAGEIAALNDEAKVLDAEAAQVEAIRAFSLDKLPKEMAVRDVKTATFAETLDFVGARLRRIAAARREVERKRQALQPELAARSKRLADVQASAQLEERSVVVEIAADGDSRRASLSLTYLTPGATWEPLTELRASGGNSTVGIAQFALVTQNTGEDWEGAKISLSTQRPSDTLRVPQLEALTFGGGPVLAGLAARAGASFQRALSSYSSQNQAIGKARPEIAASLSVLEETQRRVERAFESVRERGTTAHFHVPGSRTVRADGKSVRLPIGAVDLAAAQRLVAAPELSLNAARTLDLVNAGPRPLLPGKVSLFLDGAFLGNSELPFVSQGEAFQVFAGVADRVKLARTVDRKRSSVERSGKRTRLTVSWLISAENLSEEAVALDLAERVPVSALADVEVEILRIQPEVKPDREGVLHWDAKIGPKQSRTWRVEYSVRYPPALAHAVLPADRTAPAHKLLNEIQSLEQMF